MMFNKIKISRLVAACILFCTFSQILSAQEVVYPQAKQAGVAFSKQRGKNFDLYNNLLRTRFFQKDGKLFFGGCKTLGLLPGTELFTVKLASGQEILASQMTLTNVELIDLKGNSHAAKAALRFAGKALTARYTFGDLSIVWTAELRDGSHYLRTNMDITAARDVAMSEIKAMIYEVDNLGNGGVPLTVGNTRGSLLASDRIFAGLETPMGLNSAGTGDNFSQFTYDSWSTSSFVTLDAEMIPKALLQKGTSHSPQVALDAQYVRVAQGYLIFQKAGKQTITFDFQDGHCRLNLIGVDLLDMHTREVVASDYHFGFSGGEEINHVYTLDIPKVGNYIVRYFVETKSEPLRSTGVIRYSAKVKAPTVIYDLDADAQPLLTKARSAQSESSLAPNNMLITESGWSDSWTQTDWTSQQNTPLRIQEMGFQKGATISRSVFVAEEKSSLTLAFTSDLNLIGVDLLDKNGDAVAYDYHQGKTTNNVFKMEVPFSGAYTMRYWIGQMSGQKLTPGTVALDLSVAETLHLPAPETTPILGLWRRNTTLQAGRTWNVSAVVGLIAPGQARRSVLAYVERERAVPWRAYPMYNSWYELNIDRNNDIHYTGNMNIHQCVDVMQQWKKNLFDKHHVNIEAFVWDDGWDSYGTWTFNPNFPNGFHEVDSLARLSGTGIGAWVGPVGGYGQSGDYRRAYWTNRNQLMRFSNPDYYNVFVESCSKLIRDYDFRYFKFDGISAQWTSVGPDETTEGEENAEGIIHAESVMRSIKNDIFFNTSVGTWASPFWFRYTDAVWRQENDWSTIGDQGNDRERWITYRDRLVYQNFVQNSPFCPINCLMTHGFILTKHGDVSRDMSYQSILNELRCAFACGSGMVELYADYELLNSIENGALWREIADCIKWQKKNADVLPDIHWVGGNPWNGNQCEVYGWAAWNGQKATFTLRNGAEYSQTFKTTLREALDIPSYIKTSIVLHKAFSQAVLSGVHEGEPVDIDEELQITLPALSVYVFDGVDLHPTEF